MEDRATIQRHLAQAEAHVAQGEIHLARQKAIISELDRDGHADAAETARELLVTFETSQKALVEDRDRLRAELAACR